MYAPGILGLYVTTIVYELPGLILPDLVLKEKDRSFSSSFIFSISKFAYTKLWFLRVIVFESDFPTVIYSKFSFSSLILTYGTLPMPLIFSTLVWYFSPSVKLNTEEAIMTLASYGVKYILNSFLHPGLK